MDSVLNWKMLIDNTSFKLSTASYTISILKQTVSQDIMIMTYFADFHSIMEYAIIFWSNSRYANEIFKLQKNKNNHSYREQKFMSRIV